mmetsp:Transcript_36160/g.108239  ORF Transcript_36160/g.108239 Transcript_36160/m.108239 type:complete len:241 (-) Transcript_36160:3403-4125(-)
MGYGLPLPQFTPILSLLRKVVTHIQIPSPPLRLLCSQEFKLLIVGEVGIQARSRSRPPARGHGISPSRLRPFSPPPHGLGRPWSEGGLFWRLLVLLSRAVSFVTVTFACALLFAVFIRDYGVVVVAIVVRIILPLLPRCLRRRLSLGISIPLLHHRSFGRTGLLGSGRVIILILDIRFNVFLRVSFVTFGVVPGRLAIVNVIFALLLLVPFGAASRSLQLPLARFWVSSLHCFPFRLRWY